MCLEQALEKQLLVEQCQRVKQRNSDLAVSAEQLSTKLSVRFYFLFVLNVSAADLLDVRVTRNCNRAFLLVNTTGLNLAWAGF